MQPDLTSCEVCHLLSRWTASRSTELGALVSHQGAARLCGRPGRSTAWKGALGSWRTGGSAAGHDPQRLDACSWASGDGLSSRVGLRCGCHLPAVWAQRISPAAQRPVCTSQRVPTTVPGTEGAKRGPLAWLPLELGLESWPWESYRAGWADAGVVAPHSVSRTADVGA